MDAREDRKTLAGMLQRGLGSARNHSGKDCPPPDLLAAYYERTLTPAERERCETHFSSCALCQGQLAALARSEPEPQPQRFWFWSWHSAWKWLPPAVVALTAVALWIVLLPPSTQRLERKPLEVATTAPAAPKQQQALREEPPSAAPAPPALEKNSGRTSVAAVEEKQKKVAKHAVGNPGSSMPAPTKGMAEGAMAQVVPPAAAEKAVPAGQAGVMARERSAQVGAAAATVEAETADAARPPSIPVGRGSVANRVHPGYAAAAPDSARQNGAQLQVLEVRSAEVLIPSPDPAVQWRIGRNGIIERTTDGGKVWSGQFANGTLGLVAGSAPSAKVCWVVGRTGAVLRTTDGENWEKITSPAMTDFKGIKARDEKIATIIAVDGRSFSTQDGGKTWQAVQ